VRAFQTPLRAMREAGGFDHRRRRFDQPRIPSHRIACTLIAPLAARFTVIPAKAGTQARIA